LPGRRDAWRHVTHGLAKLAGRKFLVFFFS